MGEVSRDWRKANVTPLFQKGGKEDVGNHRAVSLTLIPRKTEHLILQTIGRCMNDMKYRSEIKCKYESRDAQNFIKVMLVYN